jgi:2-polyprenyl-6-methoxyphenol hydroxylase-like FAD-dependent oxidoreductase
MSSQQPISVVIVGAGLGGLVLARVLHVRNQASSDPSTQLQMIVLEGDASEGARSQGGLLDIHDDSGQIALQSADLLQQFAELAHPEGEAIKVADLTGNIRLDNPAERGAIEPEEKQKRGGAIIPGRPECDRGQLRKMLIDSLPDGTVRWGSKVAEVEAADAEKGGRGRITLKSGETVEADFIVGADGAWSRVRPLLSSKKPKYTGMTYVELHVDDVDKRAPEVAKLVGNGMFMALAHKQGIFVHRTHDGHLHTCAAITVPEEWTTLKQVDFTDVDAVKVDLCKKYADWAPIYHAMINASVASPGPVARPLYTLPLDHHWAHRTGVTLVGDAAHLLPPVGDGANLAMQDGAELAGMISDALDQIRGATSSASSRSEVLHSIDSAISSYESSMFTRSSTCARDSAVMLGKMFDEQAPQGIVDFFQAFMQGGPEGPGGENPISSAEAAAHPHSASA